MFLTFNEGTKPGMLTCTDTKIWFHKDNLVKILPQKYQIYRNHIHFLSHYCLRPSSKKLFPVENSKIKYLLKITSRTGVPGLKK